jgi:hypothetical protein
MLMYIFWYGSIASVTASIAWVLLVNLCRLGYLIQAVVSHNECERHYFQGLYNESSLTRMRWDLSASNSIREQSCARWGWAVPTAGAVRAIAQAAADYGCACVVDYGAGRGFWSFLLSQQGIAVVAIDANPSWYPPHLLHHPIIAGGIGPSNGRRDGPDRSDEAAVVEERAARERLSDRRALLLLVWPPCWSPMAADALDAFAGPAVAYVGEPAGGRTASPGFFSRLAAGWCLRRRVRLPNWAGCCDALHIYARRDRADG